MFNTLNTSCSSADIVTQELPRIVTNIEGGNIHNINKLSSSHFSLQMKPDKPSVYEYPEHHGYWFYFGIEGAAGREIRIDITNCDWMPRHWKNYKPVYSYADDPHSLSGVEWNRIDKTERKRNRFSFTQYFVKDKVWVALRYPYSFTRGIRYIESIRNNEYVKIEELGKTAMGNPIYMVMITENSIDPVRKKGILVYAREHGVEQDGSWVAEGIIDFLISRDPVARVVRRNTIFMIIPVISPDSAVTGQVVDPETGNSIGQELMNDNTGLTEARLLYDRVERFVRNGYNLDIAISLHNPHGTEPNIYPHYRPYRDTALLKKARKLHKSIINNSSGYTKWKQFTSKSCAYSVGRFAKDFGSIAILYEVNHQAKNNFLTIEKLQGLGKVFIMGIAEYYGHD